MHGIEAWFTILTRKSVRRTSFTSAKARTKHLDYYIDHGTEHDTLHRLDQNARRYHPCGGASPGTRHYRYINFGFLTSCFPSGSFSPSQIDAVDCRSLAVPCRALFRACEKLRLSRFLFSGSIVWGFSARKTRAGIDSDSAAHAPHDQSRLERCEADRDCTPADTHLHDRTVVARAPGLRCAFSGAAGAERFLQTRLKVVGDGVGDAGASRT